MELIMTQLQEKGGAGTSWIDVEFLRHACDAVFMCREVLKYTYVHAYYLDDPQVLEEEEGGVCPHSVCPQLTLSALTR
jgi:hypothetical protein